jgi:type 1 fimbriae regulatory protein FimB/type 1 fimbriae regulatory protein FimE
MQAKPNLKLVAPSGEKRAVPVRRPNSEYRKREHLTSAEVAKLIDAAKSNRYGQRDATMILVAFRHGLRATEVCELEWAAIDFTTAEMQISRSKGGKSATHPVRGDELRELRKLRRASTGPFVFMSERGAPFTRNSFNYMVKRAGQKAKLPFQCHAHMLRHACGYKLAGDNHDTRSIQAYLGHKDIRHTVRYTELSSKPFKDFWRD